MTKQAQTQTHTIEALGYALEDLDIAPSVMTTLANMEAARQDSRSLTPEDRAAYVAEICRALKLNPLTRPVQFLSLQNREVLYLTRGATDQLAARHGLNRKTIEGPDFRMMENVKVAYCKVEVTLPSGRCEQATATLKMTSPADDLMKVETKAKRRGTLSILGIGVLSEEEAESVAATERANDRRETQRREEPRGETRPASSNAPASLPRDNGPSPSGAPLPDAPAAPSALTEREHAAMLAMIAAAPDAAALKASLAEIADDVRRGTDEQQAALRTAAKARFAALAPPANTDGDEPPPGDGPKPRGGRRSAPKGAASADAPAAPQGAPAEAQEGAAAWLLSLDATPAAVAAVEAHLATKRSKPEVENSARKHGAALGARPWALRLYGERLAAIVAGDADMCTRNVTAWAAAGSQAAAQRRAA